MGKKEDQDLDLDDEQLEEEQVEEEETEEEQEDLYAPMELDLTEQTVPVKLKVSGRVEDYYLKECSEDERASYLTMMRKQAAFGADGSPKGMRDFRGMQSELIARCLFKKNKNQPVKAEAIGEWPSSIVQRLYERCVKLCAIEGSQGATKAKKS